MLIYKDLAIFKPGGKNCIVALDKATGETRLDEHGLRRRAGVRLLHRRHLPGSADDRDRDQPRARSPSLPRRRQAALVERLVRGQHGQLPHARLRRRHVFWSNGYGKGGICLKLKKEDDQVTADEAWTTKDLICHHGGYVIHEGHIYGNHEGGWTCLELTTGKKMWNERAVGKGSLCFADGMLYLFSENGGQAGLATCSPEGLELKGKVKVDGKGPSWAHPVVVGRPAVPPLRYEPVLLRREAARVNEPVRAFS